MALQREGSFLTRPFRQLRANYDGIPAEVWVLASVAFIVAMGFGILIPVITVFAESFGASVTLASSVISVFAFTRLIATAPAGLLINRIGERVVLATGLAIVAITSFLAGLAQSIWELLLWRGLGGFGSAMFTVSAVSLLIRVAPQHLRGRASSLYQGGFLIGGIIGPGFGGLLAFSLRAPFFWYAAMLAIATVVTLVFLARHHELHVELEDPVEHPEDLPSGAVRQLRDALKDRAYVAVIATSLAQGFATFGLRNALIPLFVVGALAASTSITGLGFVVAASASALFLVYAGRVTDLKGRKLSMVTGSSLSLLGSLLLIFWETEAGFFVAMAILGVGGTFWSSAMPAIMGDITGGKRSGPLVGTYQGIADLGAIAGPLAAGAILDATGSFPIAFGAGAAAVAVTFVLSLLMPETRYRSNQV